MWLRHLDEQINKKGCDWDLGMSAGMEIFRRLQQKREKKGMLFEMIWASIQNIEQNKDMLQQQHQSLVPTMQGLATRILFLFSYLSWAKYSNRLYFFRSICTTSINVLFNIVATFRMRDETTSFNKTRCSYDSLFFMLLPKASEQENCLNLKPRN